MIGQLIQTYRVEELLGEGGMGAVYRATDTVLDRPVALKMLQADLLTQPQFLDRFRSEAQILARLNHPNIATLFNFIREGNQHYMVMEFVEGQTLEQWLAAYGPMPYSLAVPIVQLALEGLNHAHKRGILHRDLKPANLMVTPEGVVKLTDFGIARVMGSQRLTQVNGLVGTPAYMAPEQILGQELTPASDVHAMGLVLYELLSGDVPFSATSSFETMERVIRMTPPALRPKLEGLPPALDQILAQALQKNPTDRFPDARAFQKALLTITPYTPSLDEAAVEQYHQSKPPKSNKKTPPAGELTSLLEEQIQLAGEQTLIDNERSLLESIPVTPAPAPFFQVISAPPIPAESSTVPVSPTSKTPVAEPLPKEQLSHARVTIPASRPLKTSRHRLIGLGAGLLVILGIGWWLAKGIDTPATGSSLASTMADSSALTALVQTSESVNVAPSSTSAIANPSSTPNKPTPAATPSAAPNKNQGSQPGGVTPSKTNQPSVVALTDDDLGKAGASRPTMVPVSSTPTPTLVASPEDRIEKPASGSESRPNLTVATTAEPDRPVSSGTRSLRLASGTEVLVSLQDAIAAATAVKGQRVSLRVTRSVSTNGEVLIPAGSEVQGDITGVDTGGKKEMLELRVRSIQTPSGQTVPVRGGTFKYVGSKGEAVQFRNGQQFVVYTAQSLTF